MYERLFKKWEKKKKEEESEDSSDLEVDIREDFIHQRKYEKFQELAVSVWDAFTSGNAKEKNKKQKEEEAKDKAQAEMISKKLERESRKNAAKFKRQNAIRREKGDGTEDDSDQSVFTSDPDSDS